MSITEALPTFTSKTDKRHYWLSHVEKWQQSALKQPAYCAQAGIRHSTFTYWRKVFLAEVPLAKKNKFIPVK